MTTIAVVGTGRMGSAMARALARTDSELLLYNRTTDRCRALAEQLGARVVDSPAEAAAAADVSITMLADGPAVQDVWRGDDGLLAGAKRGSVLVDSSTVPPDVIRSFEADARQRGAGILDAPVSGSVQLAEGAKLTIMVGGEAADLERARPVLEQLATRVTHIGPLGSGAAMKLSVNTLIFALNQAVSEALVLAERAGIDRATAYDVFATSAAGAPYVGYKRDAFLDPDSAAVAFSLGLAEKDLHLILELAEGIGVPMPQARADLDSVQAAIGELGEERDASALAAHLRGISSGKSVEGVAG
jgi:3-hydroxyisobutyrate dehydrogenase/2-hydroxy-3-oxopropionate reductase